MNRRRRTEFDGGFSELSAAEGGSTTGRRPLKERIVRLRRRGGMALVAVIVSAAAVATACSNTHDTGQMGSRIVRGASPDAGKQQIVRYGCGACHQIPGVKNAGGLVGPPLIHFGKRGTIAGHFANTPDNLINWIDNPQAMVPGTDMPDLGVTHDEARNIAAYLENLQ